MASATDQHPGFAPLEPASLIMEDGTPWSDRYRDVYYSRGCGIEESSQVFLEASGLPERWTGRDVFTVAETGFGTGLNFLLTRSLWQSGKGPGWLHYLSAELHPFTPRDMARLATTLPAALRPLGETLAARFPEPIPGIHRVIFADERLTLTLLFGAATGMLEQCDAQVDAWYLDGFAPTRNGDLWNASLYREIARLTAVGGTVATYTAAGHVRRGLAHAGFYMERRPGFGQKRERLTGQLKHGVRLHDSDPPWFHRPAPARPHERSVAVIGAGLAGSAVALALARRGWEVTVLEKGASAAHGASGNPAGILMPHLSADHGIVSRFTLAAAEFARNWIESLGLSASTLPRNWCGALWLADGARLARRLARIAQCLPLPDHIMCPVDAGEADRLAGAPLGLSGLFLPKAGWVDPAALCRAQLGAPGISLLTQATVSHLRREAESWRVQDAAGRTLVRASHVVMANAMGIPALHPGIEARPLRGQLSLLPLTSPARTVKRILCYEGYLTPPTTSGQVCGASFVRGDAEADLRPEEHAGNLAALARIWPDATAGHVPLAGRAAVRYNAPGRLPLVGPVPTMQDFDTIYADLHRGRSMRDYPDAPTMPGVFMNLAHGSRGLTSTPLCAELLASMMHGEPLPLTRDLVHALHPARDRVRALKQAHPTRGARAGRSWP